MELMPLYDMLRFVLIKQIRPSQTALGFYCAMSEKNIYVTSGEKMSVSPLDHVCGISWREFSLRTYDSSPNVKLHTSGPDHGKNKYYLSTNSSRSSQRLWHISAFPRALELADNFMIDIRLPLGSHTKWGHDWF